MNPDFAERRLVDAETGLAQALQRLHALRRAALAGGYDPTEFDRALVAYRRAEREALAAREAWAALRSASVATAESAPSPEAQPFVPTPRLRFMRWMVERGRISEWNVD